MVIGVVGVIGVVNGIGDVLGVDTVITGDDVDVELGEADTEVGVTPDTDDVKFNEFIEILSNDLGNGVDPNYIDELDEDTNVDVLLL
jgi:hypothetical protein